MSINSNPVNIFMLPKYYQVESIKKNEVQKTIISNQFKGKLLVLVSIVSQIVSVALLSNMSISTTSLLPAILPVALCSFSLLTLALAIFFYSKKASSETESNAEPQTLFRLRHFTKLQNFYELLPLEQRPNKVDLLAVLLQPEFRENPLKFLEKWHTCPAEFNRETKLVIFLCDGKVNNYLHKEFGAIPQAFIPHKHYKWSIVSKNSALQLNPSFTYAHFNKIDDLINETCKNVDNGQAYEYCNNLRLIMHQRDFIVDPLNYIAKWKKSQEESGEYREQEDRLISAFTNQKVKKYLEKHFSPVVNKSLVNKLRFEKV